MLGEALSFPRNGDDTIKTLVIGAACLVFSFLILPAILLQGYMIRVLKAAAEGSATPPSFDRWGEMFVDGLKLLLISIGYFITPVVLYLVAFAVVGGGMVAGGDIGAGIGILGGLLFLVTLLVMLIAGYLLPAGATIFARTDEVGAAFDIGTVTSGAFTSDYFVAWLIAVVVGGVLNIVGSLLSVILVGFLILFYGQVVTYYLFGRGFARGLGDQSGTSGTTAGDPGVT